MIEGLEGIELGNFRSGTRIVTPRHGLVLPSTTAVKLYTLTPNPERFTSGYLTDVREYLRHRIGEGVPRGIGLGFTILSENSQSLNGYLSITMWQQEADSSPPTPHSHLYTFDSGFFPRAIVDRGVQPYCMYEQQIAGYEARSLDNLFRLAGSDSAIDSRAINLWFNDLCHGTLPLEKK